MKVTQTIFAIALFVGSASANKNIRGTADFERMLQEDLGTTCQGNTVCAAMGLEGACCPTADGVMLDCCNRACEAHDACSTLADSCCPTADGVELECCDHQEALADLLTGRSPGATAACSSHESCAGLGGDCCPTVENVFLDCCTST